jgi:hypothetical protein
VPLKKRGEVRKLHKEGLHDARFEAFTTVIFQVEVFWAVTPWSVVAGYQRFRDPCWPYLQAEVGGSMDL